MGIPTEQRADAPVAVVTGASSGFGEAITHRLADMGWYTIGLARRDDRLAALAEQTDGWYQQCDLTKPEQIKDAADEILGRVDSIDLLVNNAGMALRERLENTSYSDFMQVLATNIAGGSELTNRLLPGLERNGGADVVNIVSAAGSIINTGSAPYGASKHGQLAVSRAQTHDLRPRGIRVHSILPGKANTEGHPQKESKSPIAKLTKTDVGSVTDATVDRIGKRPRDIYVPKTLGFVAILTEHMPHTTTRIVNKLIS